MLSRAPTTYTFVGITRDWNVVLFGDGARLIEEGSTAKEIAPISAPSRRSLFQAIFGKSAFDHSQSVQAVPAERPGHCRTSKDVFGAFDSPTHLMPPLGNLYDLVMEGLLKRRSETAHDGTMVPGDDDIEMDEEDAVAVVADARRPRIVSREEVDTFIELFRKHSIQCLTHPNANGHLDVLKKGKSSVRSAVTSGASTPQHGGVNQINALRTDGGGAMTGSISSSSAVAINGRKRKNTSS